MTTLHGQLMEEKLREASCLGDTETAIKLLRVGVDVNSRNAINGWTALHWACKRSHIPIVTLLLKNGADKAIQNTTGETPADLTTNSQIKSLLENGIPETFQHDLPRSFADMVGIHHSDKQPYGFHDTKEKKHSKKFEDIIVLKVRIANSPDPDFIEIELPSDKLTYKGLVEICSEELGLLPEQIIKVRKLPDTRLRNDRDIQRLKQWQELELVVQDGVAGSTNMYQPITNKNQTVLY